MNWVSPSREISSPEIARRPFPDRGPASNTLNDGLFVMGANTLVLFDLSLRQYACSKLDAADASSCDGLL